MEKNHSLRAVVALALWAAVQPRAARAQEPLAPEDNLFGAEAGFFYRMTDNYGFAWRGKLTLPLGAVVYDVNGTVNIGPPPDWIVTGTVEKSPPPQDVFLRATNPAPDDCTFATDWFEYTGTVGVPFVAAGVTYYPMSGTWESFCTDVGVISSGTWCAEARAGNIQPPTPACRVGGRAASESPATVPPALRGRLRGAASTADGYALASYPNPFARETAISFTLPGPPTSGWPSTTCSAARSRPS